MIFGETPRGLWPPPLFWSFSENSSILAGRGLPNFAMFARYHIPCSCVMCAGFTKTKLISHVCPCMVKSSQSAVSLAILVVLCPVLLHRNIAFAMTDRIISTVNVRLRVAMNLDCSARVNSDRFKNLSLTDRWPVSDYKPNTTTPPLLWATDSTNNIALCGYRE